MLNYSVKRLYRFEGEGSLRAVADVAIGEEVVVKGFRVVNGKKGLFVSEPQQVGKDGKWYPTTYVLNDEIKKEIEKVVMEAFESEE